MARQERIPSATDFVQDEPTLRGDHLAALRALVSRVIRKINGLISFGDGRHTHGAGNLDGQWLTYTAPSTPDVSFGVPHGLGRVPVAVFSPTTQGTTANTEDKGSSLGYNIGVFVYADASTAWTTDMVWLKCNMPSAKLLLLVV